MPQVNLGHFFKYQTLSANKKGVPYVLVRPTTKHKKYMKNGIIARTALTIAAVLLFASCGETYMEEHQNAYEPTDVVPVVLGITGPTSVMKTEIHTYTPSYFRSGSTWSWSVWGATLQSVSADTRTATVEFDTYPPNGIVTITVRETTSAGIESVSADFEITVLEIGELAVDFCWDKDITVPGVGTLSAADEVDFDFFYADAVGFDPGDVWATAIDWAAASAEHPESYSFEGMDDGSYYFVANLFSNAFTGQGTNATIPITAVFNRPGTILIDYELTQAEGDAMDSDQPGYDDDGTDFNMVLFRVTIANGEYTIYDAHDANMGTYKKGSAGKAPRLKLNK